MIDQTWLQDCFTSYYRRLWQTSLSKNVLERWSVKLEIWVQISGFSYTHILCVLNEVPNLRTSQEIDLAVSAEVLDPATNLDAYETVTSYLLHWSCGIDNPKASCMEDGKCRKRYSHTFENETFVNLNYVVKQAQWVHDRSTVVKKM